jgi:hypothetical protein
LVSWPVPDVPSIGFGEIVQAGGARSAELAVGVVRLHEVPLARADRHMVPVAQHDGAVVDARMLPEERQVVAWQRGLIPYVPARGE